MELDFKALAAGLASAVAVSFAHARIDDSGLATRVEAALLCENGLTSIDVSVESYRGRVLLSGFVQDDEQRKKALLVASKVAGVHEVKDGMTVR